MDIGKISMLRSFVESLKVNDSILRDSVLEALDVLADSEAAFESEEDAAADAGRAAADMENIDKSIEQTNASAEALANAQQHRIEAVRSSPLATDDERSNIETQAAEKTQQIRQSADAKTAELTERKKAIEANLAAKQAEPA